MYAMLGLESAKAVVSFHGGLSSLPNVSSEVKAHILVQSGGSDDTATEIMDLEDTFKGLNATWEITRYSGIDHAFTVFSDPRYNEWADMRSWETTAHYLKEKFGETTFTPSQPMMFNTTDVEYVDELDGEQLKGYLAMPSSKWEPPYSAVVIIPYVAFCCKASNL